MSTETLDDYDKLDFLVEYHGIQGVLLALAELCDRNVKHTVHADASTARRWATVAVALNVVAKQAEGL